MDRVSAGHLTRRGFLVGTSGALVALVAACSGSDGNDASPGGASIENKFGTAHVPVDPQRIVSVGYNDQDAVLALGGTLVGTFDWYGDYPSGVWPWAQGLLNGSTPEIVGTAASTVQIEKVAAAAPDLIVGTYSGLTQTQYDKLSALAPTVAQPKEYADYGIPWQAQTTILGKALGREDKAAELIAAVESTFADVKAANPAFAGKTVLVGALKGPGQFGVYGPEDPKVRFFTEMGFVNPPVTDQITGNFAEISTEQLSLADVDVLVWYAGGGYGDKLRAELDKTPIYQQLDVVKDGRTIILEDTAAEAMTWSTVLSLPFALEQIPPLIADLLH